jgi:hypothetical protein
MEEEDRTTRKLMRVGAELDETWGEFGEEPPEPNEVAETEPDDEGWP